MLNIRMALESNGDVFALHLTRIENGVAYLCLADADVQCHDRPGRVLIEAEGGQPEDTQSLSPGAEEGEEAEQPDEAGASVETPGTPVQAGLEPPPPEIGQSIMASDATPKRSTGAKKRTRP